MASRPDLLPFALPHRVGLPYHGLVKSGILTLPDASTLTYPATHATTDRDRKRSIVVRGRNYAATVSSVGQPANYRWQNYALLSGAFHEIGGQQLSAITGYPARSWIYSDSDHSWIVRFDISQSTSSITLTAVLVGSFGLFSDTALTMSPRTLATYTFSPVRRDTGVPVTWSGSWQAWLYPSQYGDSVMLFMVPPTTGFPLWYEAVTLTISGDGSIAPGIVGSGIAATFAHHADAAALFGANVRHVGKNYSGTTIESGYTVSDTFSSWFAEEDGVDYTYGRHVGSYGLWVGSLWTLNWSFDYTERWPSDDPSELELVSGSYPDTVSGFGAKSTNTDIISAEIDVGGIGGVVHYLIHLSAGLLVTMPTDSYWTPACDPITGDYSMDRNDEFYV